MPFGDGDRGQIETIADIADGENVVDIRALLLIDDDAAVRAALDPDGVVVDIGRATEILRAVLAEGNLLNRSEPREYR